MDPLDIEIGASHGNKLPHGLTLPEQLLFMAFRHLHACTRAGVVTREQAHAEKAQLLSSFSDQMRRNQIYQETCDIRVKLAGYSKEVEDGTCERCKKLMRIFDGRQIEPGNPRTEVTITEVGNA